MSTADLTKHVFIQLIYNDQRKILHTFIAQSMSIHAT